MTTTDQTTEHEQLRQRLCATLELSANTDVDALVRIVSDIAATRTAQNQLIATDRQRAETAAGLRLELREVRRRAGSWFHVAKYLVRQRNRAREQRDAARDQRNQACRGTAAAFEQAAELRAELTETRKRLDRVGQQRDLWAAAADEHQQRADRAEQRARQFRAERDGARQRAEALHLSLTAALGRDPDSPRVLDRLRRLVRRGASG
ncbi:hypothetical protein SAMN04487819_116102 [Actinopolyspora alba]|uniref:Uncharacterized protein n=1 Tax=Actinopolyspora alba TaxID=673379 RepID=A0A1I2BGY8_9ACTN|nr:hypothetical protein [Actinopolyspora alba]SFE55482.1 hypothetical protein SAMN04487819_116102 [Actinopolyspora alba]